MVFPQTILPISVELYIDGAWTTVTSYVQTRGEDRLEIRYGRANEAQATEPGRMTLNLNNRDGRFSPRNPNSPLYGKIGRNTPIRAAITGSGSLSIDAPTGTTPTIAYVSTPDAAALDLTGDLELIFDAHFDTWRGYAVELVGKWTETGNQRSYLLTLETTGKVKIYWSADGTATLGAFSNVLPITTGRLAVRAALDVNNGAGGATVTFYTGPSAAGPWTVLSTSTQTPTTSVFAGTSPLYVGDIPATGFYTKVIHGRVFAAKVISGLAGTAVANPDFTAQAEGATSFADSTGKTWTLSGDVSLTDKDVRFTGEVTQWPQKWDSSGVDVYVPVECYGILRRLGQGSAPLLSTMRSGILTRAATTLLAYWPLEDEDQSTQAASGLAGGLPMTITSGPPTFAADSDFDCSYPIAVMANGSLSGGIRANTSTGSIGVQLLLHVPAGGATNGAVIARLTTTGTARRWDLIYLTSGGGDLNIIAYDSDGAAIAGGMTDTGFGLNGRLLRCTLELSTSGANINCNAAVLEVGSSYGIVGIGSVNSRTVGAATRIQLDPTSNLDDVGIGHVSVDNAVIDLFAAYQELNAYEGEAAGTRIERLCAAKGVAFSGLGTITDSALMGPQLPLSFLDLLQEAADADAGILFEPRSFLGLGYLPRAALYLQPADLALTYSSKHLSGLEPVEDDQLIRNDVTVTRPQGSSYRATLATGRMSVLDPPDGVGVYDTSITLNVFADDDLADAASWRVRLGTVDEARYPVVDLNLARSVFAADAALTLQAATLDVGSRLTIGSLPAWFPPEPVSQIVSGYAEVLGQYTRTLSINCVPSAPYDTVAVWGPAVTVSRYSSDGSTVGTTMNTTTTTMSIATPSGPLWITTALVPADFPIPAIVEGETMSITAITGTSSPQTATVVRSVNGIVKAHTAGAVIDLYPISYYAL